jgi:hypothetical protein
VPRRRAGRQEGRGGGGAVQGERRERLDPEPHAEARARRPGVVGRKVWPVGAGGPWCPMDGWIDLPFLASIECCVRTYGLLCNSIACVYKVSESA